jgi:hypothetical protein
MGYLGTKPANSPLTSELIPNSIITDPKIAAMAATKLTGQVPDANAPVGSVIQMVSSTVSSNITTTSTSYVSTGQSLSITPINTSSKIAIIFTCEVHIVLANTATYVTIYRNGSQITGDYVLYSGTHSGTLVIPLAINYVDSPATTSAITYEIYFKEGGVPGTATIGPPQRTLTVMEISG